MYRPHPSERRFLLRRARGFREQIARRLSGALSEEEFRPLRLRNGLYLMLHGYMLRVAIPHGTLSAPQMRALADVAERWDRGYGHFTTRQNIQFHWPRLTDVPDMLEALAAVGLHGVQSSGNCIRNVTADPLAGAAPDELADPRPVAELIRLWSTDHPEFSWLPRKFKIAVTGSPRDGAATRFHDVGVQLVAGAEGAPGYRIILGGGLGRTPMVGRVLRDFLPRADLLPYLEAVLRLYNLQGRRDNRYKARVKITLHETGIEAIRARVEADFRVLRGQMRGAGMQELARIEADFAPPAFLPPRPWPQARDPHFRAFLRQNTGRHRQPGYAIVTVSLKAHGQVPGDADAGQMRALAAIAEDLAHGELRVDHRQNILLPHVPLAHLQAVHERLAAAGLATPNAGLISDVIACPGMDYCDLATARSIPLAQAIARHFRPREGEIGPLRIRISGCINACGHHHLGDIGILGLQKAGRESYQVVLGGAPGAAGAAAAIARPAGPGLDATEILAALDRLVSAYLRLRAGPEEQLADTLRRLGPEPFRRALHAQREASHAA